VRIESDAVTEEILTDENDEVGNFTSLNDLIANSPTSEIKLEKNYKYDSNHDSIKEITISVSKDNLVIDGQNHTIDGAGKAKIFDVLASNVTLKNINFINAKGVSGAIHANGDLNVNSCNFINNSANSGAAIFATNNANLKINNCNFKNNRATYSGGAIYAQKLSINHSKFINNTANDGGAVYLNWLYDVSTLSLTNTIFKNNTANANPDLYYDKKASVEGENNTPNNLIPSNFQSLNKIISNHVGNIITLDNDYIYNPNTDEDFIRGIEIEDNENNANLIIDGKGHTINGLGLARIFYVDAVNVTLKNINFINGFCADEENDFGKGAAAKFVEVGSVINCNFTNNSVETDGGALFFNSDGTVDNCIFKDNHAEIGGGALYFDENGVVLNSKFINNTAEHGGALKIEKIGSISNSEFTNNAAIDGGAVYVGDLDLTIKNCNFEDNVASNSGGAVFSANLDMINSTSKTTMHQVKVVLFILILE
jgi:predicted outer membrane repeat protein